MTDYALEALTILKLLQVLIISSIKFLFAPPISLEMGFSYIQTVLSTTIGGVIGVSFFYFLSSWVLKIYKKVSPYFSSRFVLQKSARFFGLQRNNAPKPVKTVFSKRSRNLILARRRYGLLGIIILTPVLLSIPVGSFLASRYFSKQRNTLLYLNLSVVFWSFFVTTLFSIL